MNPHLRFVAVLVTIFSLLAVACGDDGDVAPVDDPADEAVVDEAVVEPELEPEPERDFSTIGPIIEDFVAENELNGAGLIVVHRDEGVLYHDHWGDFSEDRISLVMSSSKMVTAGVLMSLSDQGLLDVNAPIADAVEWGAGNPDITPAQLVSNSSGLVGLGPNPSYPPYLCQFINTAVLQECAETIMTTTEDDADITGPDVEFNYGGGQWQVAGGLAEAVSGKSWAELIDETYVQPCGLETLGYNSPFIPLGATFEYPDGFDGDLSLLPPTENPNMEGGMYVTTGDYGKLLLMHLQDGMCGDTQVLSTDALAQMHGDRAAAVYDSEVGYGMGWWVDRDNGRISDGGAYGSVPWLDLEDGYGAFLVIEKTSDVGQNLAGLLYDPVEAAVVG